MGIGTLAGFDAEFEQRVLWQWRLPPRTSSTRPSTVAVRLTTGCRGTARRSVRPFEPSEFATHVGVPQRNRLARTSTHRSARPREVDMGATRCVPLSGWLETPSAYETTMFLVRRGK